MPSSLAERPVSMPTALDRPVLTAALASLGTALASGVLGYLLLAVWWPQSLIADGALLLTVAAALAVAGPQLRRHRRRSRRLGLLAATVIGLVLGLAPWAVLRTANPTFALVRHEVAEVRLPAGITEIARSQSGDRRCHDGCPALSLRYRLGGQNQDGAVTALERAYGRAGWLAEQNNPGSLFKGNLHAEISAGAVDQAQATVSKNDVSHGQLVQLS